MEPIRGPGNLIFVLQVATSWMIFNLASKAAQNSGCPILHINVVETSISRSIGDPKGVVVAPMKSGAQKVVEKRNPNRGTLSFVAMICDNPSIQPRLPQFIVGNEHILRVQTCTTLLQLCQRMFSWCAGNHVGLTTFSFAAYWNCFELQYPKLIRGYRLSCCCWMQAPCTHTTWC